MDHVIFEHLDIHLALTISVHVFCYALPDHLPSSESGKNTQHLSQNETKQVITDTFRSLNLEKQELDFLNQQECEIKT